MGICTKLMLKNLLILQFWTECIWVAEMGKTHMKQGAGGQPAVVIHSTVRPHKPPDTALLSKGPGGPRGLILTGKVNDYF